MMLRLTDCHTPSMICSAVVNGSEKVRVTFISYIGACVPVCSVLWLKNKSTASCNIMQLYYKLYIVCYIKMGMRIWLYCAAQFQHLYALLAPDSQLITVHSAPIIFRSASTGGAQPRVSRPHAPVCFSLALPLTGRSTQDACKQQTTVC